MTQKTCSECKETKPVAEFRIPQGPDYLCKVCNRKRVSLWRERNPGRNAAACKEWYGRNQRRVRDSTLRKNYGITLGEYEQMAFQQGNACAICKGLTRDGILRVDHDHDTGQVRGLLCDTCNRAIGFFRDSAATLRLAADYLDQGALKAQRNSK